MYLNGIIIYSLKKAKHSKDLRALLKTQGELNAGQTVKIHAPHQELPFLRHNVSTKGIDPDPEKEQSICQMSPPMNKYKLWTFLIAIFYVKTFIPNCSKLKAPLSALVGMKTNFDWTSMRDLNFCKLKEKLMSSPILQYFIFTGDYQKKTDASDAAISGVICFSWKQYNCP